MMIRPAEREPMKTRPMKCALCAKKECYDGQVDCFEGKAEPGACLDQEDRKTLLCASEIEAKYYFKMSRLEEIIEFCRKMEYDRLGIAFCIGLAEEAKTLHKILSRHFTVFSACCKACGLDKDALGLKKIRPGRSETMCNPVGQALLLGSEDTRLNIILGLCLGHDILFTKHSKAPVTTFAVKDRVLAHNPLGAIYSGYYKRIKFKLDERVSDRSNTD
jgi:uncharacterized metal-binding protein